MPGRKGRPRKVIDGTEHGVGGAEEVGQDVASCSASSVGHMNVSGLSDDVNMMEEGRKSTGTRKKKGRPPKISTPNQIMMGGKEEPMDYDATPPPLPLSDNMIQRCNTAKAEFELFRGREKEWFSLSDMERNRIVREGLMDGGKLTCIVCNTRSYSSLSGMMHHLLRCVESPPPSLEDDTPLQELLSFKGRLEEWRKREEAYQRKLIRDIYRGHRNTIIPCPQCNTQLSTPDGMIYHLKKCDLQPGEMPVKCSLCQIQIASQDFANHVQFVHPGSNGELSLNGRAAAHADEAEQTPIPLPVPQKRRKPTNGLEYTPGKSSSRKKRLAALAPRRVLEQSVCERLRKGFEECVSSDGFSFFHCECCQSDWKCLSKDGTFNVDEFVTGIFPFLNSVTLIMEGTNQRLNLFQHFSTHVNGGRGVFCGGPIASCAWCPSVCGGEEGAEVVAISTFADSELRTRMDEDLIQLWKVTANQKQVVSAEMVVGIVHNAGTVMDMKWCPFGAYEEAEAVGDNDTYPLQGVLAAATCSGQVLLYCVPHLNKLDRNGAEPLLVRSNPLMVLVKGNSEDGAILSVEWNTFSKFKDVYHLLTKSETDIVTLWTITRRKDDVVGCSKVLVDDAGQVESVGWLSQSLVFVTFADKQVGVLDSATNIWLYREAENPNVGYIGTSMGPGFTGILVWPENKLQKFAGATVFPHEVWILEWDPVQHKFTNISMDAWHFGPVWDIAVSHKSGWLASVDNCGAIQINGIATQRTPEKWTGHEIYLAIEDVVESVGGPVGRIDYQKCTNTVVLRIEERKRETLEYKEALKRYYEEECVGNFPISAFFRASWNQTRTEKNILCAGGQAGIVFFFPFS